MRTQDQEHHRRQPQPPKARETQRERNVSSPRENHGRAQHIERLLDEALADSFPCSDPVATLTFFESAESEPR